MIKDWVIFLGSLLILAIIIDGIRRKRRDPYGKIRMSSRMKKRSKPIEVPVDIPEDTSSFPSELPNGGARVIGHRDTSEVKKGLLKSLKSQLPKHQQHETELVKKSRREPEQTQLNLDESVPMLMESVDHADTIRERIEPTFGNDTQSNVDEYEGDNFDSDDSYDEDAPYEEDSYDEQDYDNHYDHDDEMEEEYFDESDAPDVSEHSEVVAQPSNEPEEVFIVHVMANQNNPFNGSALLDVILQCGMRYGEMDIFHRHAGVNGQGGTLFSMANIVKPGTFDLEAMDEFETPGVSFFMTLPLAADSLQTFDLMIDTAHTVADTLGGELRDDQRSIMTKQTLEHCRERIRDYERQRLFRRPR